MRANLNVYKIFVEIFPYLDETERVSVSFILYLFVKVGSFDLATFFMFLVSDEMKRSDRIKIIRDFHNCMTSGTYREIFILSTDVIVS